MPVYRQLFLHSFLFYLLTAIVLLLVLGFYFPIFFMLGRIGLFILLVLLAVDVAILFSNKKPLHAIRFLPEKLSNGDENEIRIYVENRYPMTVRLRVIDEVPYQFQKRDSHFHLQLGHTQTRVITYNLRPVKRGEYTFGQVHLFASSPLHLARRRVSFGSDITVPVYPSFLQLRKFEIMAISHRLTELGIKKVRKLGHNMEFEQIKEYVPGDDFRTINWKATARTDRLMTNTYQDEKSQNIYCLLDKGRAMKLPFDGMTLLDYAINASLVLSHIALKKDDKAGLITFHNKISAVVPAAARKSQMSILLETLYNQKTAFRESDFSKLFSTVRSRVGQRSLLLLFSNFETQPSLERRLPYLRKMAANHVLIVVFFENTELSSLLESPATTLRGIYHKSIAEKYQLEKKMITKILANYGIFSVLTTPRNLSVDTINKYLEMKARGII